MGRVRTKTVKRAARQIVEKYYSKLGLDFQFNKKVSEEVASIQSKRMRNKVAGFVTHLMRRIQKGPVRGISLKLQEEERERRMDFVPERSELDVSVIQVDQDTLEMLNFLKISLPNIKVVTNISSLIASTTKESKPKPKGPPKSEKTEKSESVTTIDIKKLDPSKLESKSEAVRERRVDWNDEKESRDDHFDDDKSKDDKP